MSNLTIARALGYPEYPEVDVNDSTTFSRLSADVQEYMASKPWVPGYHCWVPKLGCVTVGLR